MISPAMPVYFYVLSLLAAALIGWVFLPKASYAVCKRACERQNLPVLHRKLFSVLSLRWMVAALIIFTGTLGIIKNQSLLLVLIDCSCVFSLGIALLSDLICRLIPREVPGVLGVLGFVGQVLRTDATELMVSYCIGFVLVAACCWLAKKTSSNGDNVLGGGDVRCMFALVVATGPNALIGAFACYLLAAGVSLVGIIKGTFNLRTRLCFAPYFMVWLMVGLL